jgi:hypothetical protein
VLDEDRQSSPHHVITGLVPVIPMVWNAAPLSIGMAESSPAMTWERVTKDH